MAPAKNRFAPTIHSPAADYAYIGDATGALTPPAQEDNTETLVAALPEQDVAHESLAWAGEALASIANALAGELASSHSDTGSGIANFSASSDSASSTLLLDHVEVLGTIGQSLNSRGAIQSLAPEPAVVNANPSTFIAASSGSENLFITGMDATVPDSGTTFSAPESLQEPPIAAAAITTTDALDGLLSIRNGSFYANARWNHLDAVGTPVEITFSFPDRLPDYYRAGAEPGFREFSAAQKTAARAVLASIAEVTNVTFVEVPGVGDITFANSSNASGAAHTYVPVNGGRASGLEGDVWVYTGARWDSAIDPWSPGGSGYQTLIHEIGHALGLKHPHADPGGNELFILDRTLDNGRYTAMSYNQILELIPVQSNGAMLRTASFDPWTLMTLDIEALQYLYGANTATRSDRDRYEWAVTPKVYETIWDGGGNDTIDCSNQIFACDINLQGGAASSIGLLQTREDFTRAYGDYASIATYKGENNVWIAKGAIIENAIGGNGNDTLTGNDVNNDLRGGNGNDSLSGNAGNDRLWGDAGNDTLNGGTGSDRMEGGTGNDVYYVDSVGDQVIEYANEGTDTVFASITYTLPDNVENLTLSASGNINGFGNALDNVLTGNDMNNALVGGAGNDTLTGGGGDDTLYGDAGADRMEGGTGNDRYYVDNVGDQVIEYANEGIDTVFASITYTLPDHVENLTLSASGNLNGYGNSLDNVLKGSNGNNILDGGAGNDILQGGLGADILTGGRGADTFVYTLTQDSLLTARDSILDFVRGEDKLDFRQLDANSTISGLQHFSFIDSELFSAAGQLRFEYNAATDTGTLYGNTDMDSTANFAIDLAHLTLLTATDLLL